jgi:hypothetical protein
VECDIAEERRTTTPLPRVSHRIGPLNFWDGRKGVRFTVVSRLSPQDMMCKVPGHHPHAQFTLCPEGPPCSLFLGRWRRCKAGRTGSGSNPSLHAGLFRIAAIQNHTWVKPLGVCHFCPLETAYPGSIFGAEWRGNARAVLRTLYMLYRRFQVDAWPTPSQDVGRWMLNSPLNRMQDMAGFSADVSFQTRPEGSWQWAIYRKPCYGYICMVTSSTESRGKTWDRSY